MKITLPVPYKTVARINRSRSDRTEEVLGCLENSFELRFEPAADVHVIAEWQQQWDGPNRDAWRPETSGNWLADFQADVNLSRIIMIDGTFYSPLKVKTHNNGWQPYTVDDFSLKSVMELRSVMNREYGGFYEGTYFELMTEGGFWPEPGETSHRFPDLTGKTELGNDRDMMIRSIQSKLDSFVIIDNVVFRKIPEPVIGVFATKDHVKMKVAERRDSANAYTTSYFSLTDYQSAYDHYETKRLEGPDSPASLEITDVHIYMPAAFSLRVDDAELLKTGTQLLESTERLVSKMPSDIAPLWFTVRDALAAAKSKSSEAGLTTLGDAILALHTGVMRHHSASEDLKSACSIAEAAALRWETRPISSDRTFGR